MELGQGPVPADRRDEVLRGTLDRLITYTVLSQEAKTRKVTATDAEVDERHQADAAAVPERGGVQEGARRAEHDARAAAQPTRATTSCINKMMEAEVSTHARRVRRRGEGVLRQESGQVQAGRAGPRQPHPDPRGREGRRRRRRRKRARRSTPSSSGPRPVRTSPSSRRRTPRTAAPRRAAT